MLGRVEENAWVMRVMKVVSQESVGEFRRGSESERFFA